MNKFAKSIIIAVSALFMLGYLSSCEEFFNPDQQISLSEDQLYDDWYEYRAASMGLYALQQDLVEQLMVLGELRADLLTVTPNANEDLMEIYNFNISKENKYASPQNFFKLIAATNRFLSILEREYPEVLDKTKNETNNYDRLYGEALCMRAWAYFNAVRIYGKVPFIDQKISTIEEINTFLNTPASYVDSVYIEYGIDGYTNDTTIRETVIEKQYFDTDMVLRHFTQELEDKVQVVGVDHSINNYDDSWEVTVWSTWSYNTLLGHMYLTLGDLAKSAEYFEKVLYNNSDRYQLTTNAFDYNQWGNMFLSVDNREHIYTLPFNKANQQQNELFNLFVGDYMLKPTSDAVHNWETQWRGTIVSYDYNLLDSTKTIRPGAPGDYRGYATSYIYARAEDFLTVDTKYFAEIGKMLEYKRQEEYRSVASLMENWDTIVYKYTIGQTKYDQDANYIIYRAGGVNLYLAEVYSQWMFEDENGKLSSYIQKALNTINNGKNYDESISREQLGVRGRVGLGDGESAYNLNNLQFVFDPFTNEVVGHYDITNNLAAKKRLLEQYIIEERALELAFEGERFYDLMRVAKRRNDPSFLAEKVAGKYPSSQRDYIYNYLLNEQNWYINYFE